MARMIDSTVRVPRYLKSWLRRTSKKQGVSMSALIRKILNKGVKRKRRG